MKTWVRKTLSVGVLAAGALLFAPGAAHADGHQITGDNNGILNGTQIAVPVQVPVNIVGNSLGILGEANAQGVGVNRTEGLRDLQRTGDNNGIANGTQVYLPISVPVNAVGNSAAVLGEANATGVGANNVRGRKTESAHTTEGGHWFPGGGTQSTGDNNGILNGTQIYAPIDVPINVCGNSLAILGGASSQALCANNVWLGRKGHQESAHVTESGHQITGDNNGILNGTQLYAPISLPVNLAGNSAALLGEANSRGVAVNESGHGDGFVQATGDNNGILNGTQIAVPISVPINVCGNSLGILGSANSAAVCANGVGGFGGFGDDSWGGNGGHGHGHGMGHGNGHGNGGHGNGHGQNAGDNGDNDGSYLGDNGANAGDNGYGDQGAEPASAGYGGQNAGDNGDDGYQGAKPASTGSDTKANGGRKAAAEGTPVSGLTDTVGSGLGGLGLLNTLR